MASFYSSTDNANDKSGIYYSGVIGKLTDKDYEYVIRFNLYEDKKACKLDEIFEIPAEEQVKVPQEWLDNVEVKSYNFPKPSQNGVERGVSLGSKNIHQPSLWEDYHRPRGSVNYPAGLGRYPWETEEDDESLSDMISKAKIEIESGMVVFDDPKVDIDEPLDEEAFNIINYGEDAANAVALITDMLDDLTEHDDLILNVIREAYSILGENGKNELAHNGF